MGFKYLKALSKAVTYVASGMTALTGTLQAAQQQEKIDAAWADLMNTPNAAIVAEAPAGSQAAPLDALQSYLDQAGISAPVPGSGNRSRSAPRQGASVQQQGISAAVSADTKKGTPEKPWELETPAETLYNAVQDAGDGLTGGKIAEAQEKAKELDAAVHGGPRYGEYGDPPPGAAGAEKSSPGKPVAVPQSADGLPPKMLSGGTGDHFQGTYTLKPNQTYTANGATYHTDGNGAIQSWSATLSGPQQAAPRSPSHQKHLPGKLPGDHAGHYLAASNGGSGLADNMGAMDAKVNTRDYRAFERGNQQLLGDGYTLRLDGSNHMGSSPLRPDGIMVTRSVYDSDGNLRDREHFSWTNTDMSQYQNNDFGDPAIPNAMDEALDQAGMTRKEIAALEETEGTDKSEKTDRDEVEDKGKREKTDRDEVEDKDKSEKTDRDEVEDKDKSEKTDRDKVEDKDKSEKTDRDEVEDKGKREKTDRDKVEDKDKSEKTDQDTDPGKTEDQREEPWIKKKGDQTNVPDGGAPEGDNAEGWKKNGAQETEVPRESTADRGGQTWKRDGKPDPPPAAPSGGDSDGAEKEKRGPNQGDDGGYHP